MKEKTIIRFSVLVFWTFFWGLSVVDKIIPDVQSMWVGKDFYALFIKFFSSLGLKEPIYATIALAGVSALEVVNFVFYLLAIICFMKGQKSSADKWFFRAVFASISLFSLFSIGDQIFGDRFQLLEHGLFWLVLIASWVVYKYLAKDEENTLSLKPATDVKIGLIIGTVLTVVISISIFDFSAKTFANSESPVMGNEVIEGVYKFDFPFLADKLVWEKTIQTFKAEHPELNVTYIYTGPSELNSKKKTHMLLYVFTEKMEG